MATENDLGFHSLATATESDPHLNIQELAKDASSRFGRPLPIVCDNTNAPKTVDGAAQTDVRWKDLRAAGVLVITADATPPDAAVTIPVDPNDDGSNHPDGTAVSDAEMGCYAVFNDLAQAVTIEVTGQSATAPVIAAGATGWIRVAGTDVLEVSAGGGAATVIAVDDEGTEIEDELVSLDVAGDLIAATTDGSGNVTITARSKADAAAIRAGTADRPITPDGVELAAEFVTLTDGANIALDWATGLNFTVTLAGNRTLDNPSNGEPGTTRLVEVVQDGTGSRTLAFGANYKFPGGSAPTLSTGANAQDVLSIFCRTTTEFWVSTALGIA